MLEAKLKQHQIVYEKKYGKWLDIKRQKRATKSERKKIKKRLLDSACEKGASS